MSWNSSNIKEKIVDNFLSQAKVDDKVAIELVINLVKQVIITDLIKYLEIKDQQQIETVYHIVGINLNSIERLFNIPPMEVPIIYDGKIK